MDGPGRPSARSGGSCSGPAATLVLIVWAVTVAPVQLVVKVVTTAAADLS
ncbi:MAG: hypothetical protein ACRDP6_08435 [Actinoallomurus sp.]